MARRDLNSDGRSDVVWRNVDGRTAYWNFTGEGVPSLVADPLLSAAYGPGSVRPGSSGDFDGDGATDLGLIYGASTGSIRFVIFFAELGVAVSRFSGGLAASVSVLRTDGYSLNFGNGVLSGTFLSLLVTDNADFNHDGRADLIASREQTTFFAGIETFAATPTLEISNVSLTGENVPIASIPYEQHYRTNGFADFNRDGTTDVLWRHLPDGEVGIWSMSNASPFAYTALGTVSLDYTIAQVADFNGDGAGDILWTSRRADGGLAVGTWTITGGGASYGATWRDLGVYYGAWQPVSIGDFTGDGSEDVLWRNSGTGESLIWDFDGGAVSRGIALPGTSLDWQVAL